MIGGVSGNRPLPVAPDATRGRAPGRDPGTNGPPPATEARNGDQRPENANNPERPRRATPSNEGEPVRLRVRDDSALNLRSQEALATYGQVGAGSEDEGGGELLGVDVRV